MRQKQSILRGIIAVALLGSLLMACNPQVEGQVTQENKEVVITAGHRAETCTYTLTQGDPVWLIIEADQQILEEPGREQYGVVLNIGETKSGPSVSGERNVGFVSVGKIGGKEVYCPAPRVELFSELGVTLDCQTSSMSSEIRCNVK